MSKKPVSSKPEVETTGHVWDGIEELNNPLPRWWLWTLYLTIIWGIGYVIAYPAWPMLTRATQGIIGLDNRAAVAAEIERFAQANAPIEKKLVATDLTAIATDPELNDYARNAGAAVFKTWCAQCHGSGAAGAKGYPNLLDNDWLWGGTMDEIHQTVTHGVRASLVDDTRFSQMPAIVEFLSDEQIGSVVQYVLSISDQPNDAGLAVEGATVYADNCSACHMEDGTGDRSQGAPNLTDKIWLWGGDTETLTATVKNARYGVMPNWSERLSEAELRAVAAYVHQLGGGE